MIISYDFGHGTGADRGAEGILNEEAEIRKYAPITVQVLKNAGHTLVDCTPYQAGMGLNESLAYRVNKANASGSQLHLCFHVNCFNGSAHGAEIEVASDNGERIATPVLNEICALGFTRRGINRPSLYVTRHVNAVALLIEPFFCDSSTDCSIYNAEKLGDAIAKGVLEAIGGNYNPTNQPVPQSTSSSNPVPSSDNFTLTVQKQLNNIMDAGLKEDGINGNLTRQAIVNFEKKYGLTVDSGIWGAECARKAEELIKAKQQIPPAPQLESPKPTTNNQAQFNEEEVFNQMFSEKWYLLTYKDVAESVVNGGFKSGKQHYLVCGRKEGRKPCPPLPLDFNEGVYLESNPDVKKAVDEKTFCAGVEHYMLCGFAENRKYK